MNKKTTVSALSSATWKLALAKGTYKYVCDAHPTFMKGSFTVS